MTDGRDRAVGALVGLACGDAVGTTLEFRAPGSFEPITDMVGGGPFRLPKGAWTDDTSLAMCLAESILDVGELEPADQLRRYVAWRQDGYWSSTGRCFDIGNATGSALDRFRRTGEVEDARPDPEAAANGSLMRLAAVPIRWHRDLDLAVERSGESSRTTHPAPRPVDACRLMGAIVAALISGDDFYSLITPEFWRWGDLHPEIANLLHGEWRGKEPPAIRGTGYCVAALEAALWAVHGAESFSEAVLRAANLGDDADTTAAIAGQIAGARWGRSGIPDDWVASLVAGDRIEYIASRLYSGAAGVDEPPWPYDETFHAWWAIPGEVLAGEYPGTRQASETRDKLHLLVDAGVRTIVDLTDENARMRLYDAEMAAVGAERGVELTRISHPIPDQYVLDGDDGYDAIVRTIEESLASGVAFVHCWGGVGRTGTVIGCLLIDRGIVDGDGAVKHLVGLRRGSRKAHRASPENEHQVEVLTRRMLRSSQ